MNIVICPTCKENNEKSTVREGIGRTTAMWCAPFYDEEGKRHHHDRNSTTVSYSCSNGHKWDAPVYNYCWCGWTTDPGEEAIENS